MVQLNASGASHAVHIDAPTASHRLAGSLGLIAVGLFGGALVVVAVLTLGFDYWNDYVSKLGAIGQPYAIWWNLIGFLAVGAVFAVFGVAYGRVVGDRLAGLLLAAFGLGFGLTAIPVDLEQSASAASKAHIVAACLGVGAWMFALARIAQLRRLPRSVRRRANITAALVVLPILGLVAGRWSLPVTHRLVFAVMFGWVVITSVGLLRGAPRAAGAGDRAEAFDPSRGH
ncbi:MAG: DUF998 domain-containing protein [Planctomycetota bacterium]